MKQIFFIVIVFLYSCTSDNTSEAEKKPLTKEEKKEVVKVDSMQLTDKQKSDSFKKKWMEKMEKSKLGEE